MKEIQINFDWDYIPDYQEKYLKIFPKTKKINIPHANIETPFNNFDEKIYQFVSTYHKSFSLEKLLNKRYFLHFEGVMNYAKVYLNGVFIGEHFGGYTPFEFEITDYITTENDLIVVVDSTERADTPPFGFVIDYLTYGGIYREVFITEENINYIKNVFIDTDEKNVNVHLKNSVKNNTEAKFEFDIKNSNHELIFHQEKVLTWENSFDLKILNNLKKWNISDPQMYSLEIKINDKIEKTIKFGNRLAEFRSDGFYLNGDKLKLRGLNRHQSYPYVGYAMPKNAQVKDADILKFELGCNIVRTSHYPQSKHFLNRCDEIGLLVFEEIPGWQHIGDKQWQDKSLKNVEEMIIRDYNHPAIIIWGVRINESPDNDEFYQKTNQLAHELDHTRQTGGVRNFKGSKFFEDVYTYNDFVHRGDNIGLLKKSQMVKKDVPYLVTEYNGHMYPTKKFDDEIHRNNQVKRHLAVQNESYKNNDISGAIGWCMFDYNTHKDFGSQDRICYHGVLDMFRITKNAASVYSAQGLDKPYMKVLSEFHIGEYPASEIKEVIVNTNVDYIKFYINNDFVDNFYPDKKIYKYLPNPPIIIDDFIGNLIQKNENFSDKDARLIKQILQSIIKNKGKISFKYKLKMMLFLIKHKMTIDQAAKFYEKYIGKWGLESLVYRFEGYIKDELVIVKEKGSSKKSFINVYIDDLTLKEENTYETTRVVIRHQDEFKNDLIYSSEVITVETSGVIELIGPNSLSLLGGSTGFYIKTTKQKGKGIIKIKSKRYGLQKFEVEVI